MADGKSNLQTFRKVAVVNNGKLERLYWEYPDPAKNEEINLTDVVAVWNSFRADIASPVFLMSRQYHVIMDGMELEMKSAAKHDRS